MTPAILGTALGAAALTVGRGAAAAAGNGLSFVGELLKAAGSPPADAPLSESGHEKALAELKQRTADLAGRVRRQLAAAGIKLDKPVELISDGAGGIAVAADHPQGAAIQSSLSGDVLLERDFDQLNRDYREHAEAYGGFSSATLKVVIAADGSHPEYHVPSTEY